MLPSLAGLAAAATRDQEELAAPFRMLYEHASRHDLYWTHTFVQPFNQHDKPGGANPAALRIVRETADGIAVSGARGVATAAAFADRNFNFDRIRPPSPAEAEKSGHLFALYFRVSIDAPGLRWICRDFEPAERGRFDSPLASVADEVDSIALFDEVWIPREDITFLARDYETLWKLIQLLAPWKEQLTKHQTLIRNIAKTRFILGLAHLIAESSRSNKFINVQQRLGDIVLCLDVLESLAVAAVEEATREPNSGWFYPNSRYVSAGCRLFGEYYPRILDHLVTLGASRFVSTPQERTLEVLGAAVEDYFRAASPSAKQNVALHRMAWDLAGTAFGARQDLYERFFAGDYEMQKVTAYLGMDKKEVVATVERMLRISNTHEHPFPLPEKFGRWPTANGSE